MKRFLNMVADIFYPTTAKTTLVVNNSPVVYQNTGRPAKDDLSGMRERTSPDWSSQML